MAKRKKHPGGRPPLHGVPTELLSVRLVPSVRDAFLRLVASYPLAGGAPSLGAAATCVFSDMIRQYEAP